MKIEESNSTTPVNPSIIKNQERVVIIKKGSFIILAVFIVLFFYADGLFTKYYHTKCCESIISSLIVNSIFTCILGFLIGKYLTRKLKT